LLGQVFDEHRVGLARAAVVFVGLEREAHRMRIPGGAVDISFVMGAWFWNAFQNTALRIQGNGVST